MKLLIASKTQVDRNVNHYRNFYLLLETFLSILPPQFVKTGTGQFLFQSQKDLSFLTLFTHGRQIAGYLFVYKVLS
jgi:hypothetical protein